VDCELSGLLEQAERKSAGTRTRRARERFMPQHCSPTWVRGRQVGNRGGPAS
jgi:hypothetical protein